MKSKGNIISTRPSLIFNRLYDHISRDQLTKSFFYLELFNHFMREWRLNLSKRINFRSEVQELFLSFRFKNGSECIPHFKKKEKGGEDCHYTMDRLLVIADGVGGWKNHQVDPKEFTEELCRNIKDNFNRLESSHKMKGKNKNKRFSISDLHYEEECIYSEKNAKKLLIKSAETAKCLGTSTCTILLLDEFTGKVFSSYIGDSCYMILKYDKCKEKYIREFKSEEQMHSECFNTPFQVGKDGDNPQMAKTKSHQLRNNDLIISATDGLWDNLEVDRIIEIVNENTQNYPSINTQEISQILAEEAEKKSNDKAYMSPFAKKAKEHKYYYIGGKPDDITVIVSHLTNKDKNSYSANTSTSDNNEKHEEFQIL